MLASTHRYVFVQRSTKVPYRFELIVFPRFYVQLDTRYFIRPDPGFSNPKPQEGLWPKPETSVRGRKLGLLRRKNLTSVTASSQKNSSANLTILLRFRPMKKPDKLFTSASNELEQNPVVVLHFGHCHLGPML
jgi:hypothetical protein